MKNSLQLLAFFAFVVVLAAAASLGTRWLLPVRCAMCGDPSLMNPHAPVAGHHWIHQELSLTEGQKKALQSAEERYTRGTEEYLEEIRVANQELGRAILDEKENTAKVQQAIARVSDTQRKLQVLTLEHVFAMRETLSPGQYEKLLGMTAQALQKMDCHTE